MSINQINESVIARIAKGDEKSFSLLYECYYTYLNSVALCYIFDKNMANEVVNDVFVNIWQKRNSLLYPIHSYLIQSVKNGCLNHLRAQKSLNRVLGEHTKQLINFQEEYILSNPTPLQYVESQEIEKQVRFAVDRLPEKCRIIFEHYFYSGKLPEDIANELVLSVSTVRVQIKNGLDKLKVSLNHLITLILFMLLRH